jgi:signal transduction histidine kinase
VTAGRRRGSLALRMTLLATAAALITAIVAGGLTVALVQRTSAEDAQRQLAGLADVTQSTADDGAAAQNSQVRARRLLAVVHVAYAAIGPAGRVTSDSTLAKDAVTSQEISVLLGGGSVSANALVDGQRVFVEGRKINTGAIVLVQRRADALAVTQRAVRWMLLALAIAVALAVALALAVAWRMSRPLRRTADAAHALAAGRRDVTLVPEGPSEVAEVAEALNTLATALIQSEAREREFLLSVSHDLRTPLTAISGYSESLADGVIAPHRTQQVGATLLAEAQRLGRLITDLLDLARLGGTEFRIDVIDVDVVGFAQSTAQVWAARCEAVGVHFYLDSPPGPVFVRTDPSRLRQALDGLFDNALRITPAGGPIVLAVRVEAQPTGTWIAIEVRDGGPGLSDGDLTVAFDRSALYDRYRGIRQVGTGLGLAIVQGLVVRLGGRVEAGHAAEGGARFTIWLLAAR